MNEFCKIPFYAKTALVFISLFAFVYIIFIAQQIIIPLIFSVIIAIVLNPLVNYLNKRIYKTISITLVMALVVVTMLGLVYIVSTQVSIFGDSYPQLKEKFTETSLELTHWISQKFNIKESTISTWLIETQNEAIQDFAIGENITAAGETIVTLMLIPVYVVLVLYYKPLLLEFIRKIFHPSNQHTVSEVLSSIKNIIQTYLVGLFFEMIIVSIMNIVLLFSLGIPYPVILGIMGALLNIIPYVGIIAAAIISMIVAFVSSDSLSSPVFVLLGYLFIQFVDNNYIVPRIVASRVQINALISVIVVIIGGVLWGVPGMFLSIPITAILKVIFDHIESLKPYGFLLGDIIPVTSKPFINKRIIKLPLK